MLGDKLGKAWSNPMEAVRVGMGLLRGHVIKARYALTHPNVKIGSDFRAYTWLNISGPGKVEIGDKVSIDTSFLRQCHIVTHAPEASVRIHDGSYLGGVRISCVDSVEVGREARVGSSTIVDSDVIPTPDTVVDHEWKTKHVKPIKIGDYFWSGINAFILRGSEIGDECVLGAGAVVFDKKVDDRSLLVGNPSRKIGETRAV